MTSLLLNTSSDVRREVYNCLEVQDVLALNETCKDWHFETHGLSNPSLWQFLFNRDFPKYPKPSSNAQKHYEVHFVRRANLSTGAHTRQILNGGTLVHASMYGEPRIDRIRSLCLGNGQIVSGSYGGAIQIWDLQTGEKIRQIAYYINDDHFIDCMSVVQGKLFVCRDGKPCIDILDMQTGKELGMLEGHAKKVNCFITVNNTLISGSKDKTIKIWDPFTRKCVATLSEHRKAVTCFCLANEKLVSGSLDHMIKIWDLSTNSCVSTIQTLRKIASICFFDERIFARFVAFESAVWVWDVNTKKVSEYVNIKAGAVADREIAIIDEHLCFPSSKGFQIWNSKTREILRIEPMDIYVSSLLAAKGKLIYCSQDEKILIRDFNASQDALLADIAKELGSAVTTLQTDTQGAMSRIYKARKCLQTQISKATYQTVTDDCETDDQLAHRVQSYVQQQEVISKRPPTIPCVALSVACDVGYGNSLVLCGSGGDLSWHRSQGKPLHWREGKWVIQVPANVKAFKLVKVTKHGDKLWEKGDNRTLEGSRSQSIANVRF